MTIYEHKDLTYARFFNGNTISFYISHFFQENITKKINSFFSSKDRNKFVLVSKEWYAFFRERPFTHHQGIIIGILDCYLIKTTLTHEDVSFLQKQTGIEVYIPPGKPSIQNYILGRGAFSEVKLVITHKKGCYMGLKITRGLGDKELITHQALTGLPGILPLVDFAKQNDTLYQVMHLNGLGDIRKLKLKIDKLEDLVFKEEILDYLFKELITALSAMHQKRYYHLDIKLENLVLNYKGKLNIIDFGCTIHAPNGLISAQSEGDIRYLSPERDNNKELGLCEGEKADAWAAGLVLFELGSRGFDLQDSKIQGSWWIACNNLRPESSSEQLLELFFSEIKDIVDVQPPGNSDYWQIVLHFLNPNPKNRLTPSQALNSPYYSKAQHPNTLSFLCDFARENLSTPAFSSSLLTESKKAETNQLDLSSKYRKPKKPWLIRYREKGEVELGKTEVPYPTLEKIFLSPQILPLFHSTSYIERPALQKEIIKDLLGDKEGLIALHGIGGVGTTQLAIRILHDNQIASYFGTCLWFRNADNPKLLDLQYSYLAQEWELIHDETAPEEMVKKVHEKLAQESKPWLIVFDNAGSFQLLKNTLPSKGGWVLVTTRDPSWDRKKVIGMLTQEEGNALTSKLLQKEGNYTTLCKCLGYLPLALMQACAYIRNQALSVENYLELLASQPQKLLSENEQLYGTPLPYSLTGAWNFTFTLLKNAFPDALSLLNRLAYLDQEFSYPLLEKLTNNNSTIDLLTRYALLEKKRENLFSLCRLNQHLIRVQHTPQEAMTLCIELMETFKNYYTQNPISFQDEETNASILLHGEALIAQVDRLSYSHEREIRAVRDTYSWLGNAYRSLGNWNVKTVDLSHALKNQKTQTIEHYQKRVLLNWHLYPPEGHPTIARDLESLGDAHLGNEDFEQGIKNYRNALMIALSYFNTPSLVDKLTKIEKKLGYALKAFGSSLANWDKTNEALLHFQESRMHLESALSKLSPSEDKAYCLIEIAELYECLEEPQKEIEAYKQALDLCRNLFGYDDPEAVTKILHTLATALQNYDRVQEAIPYLEEALRIRLKAYGKNHPKVATRYHALGLVYKTLKDPRWIEHLDRALTIYKNLGEEEDAMSVLEDIKNP